MTDQKPTILWLRRDFRLGDHPALHAACEGGGPVIPVFICDDAVEALGSAPRWRLGLALRAMSEALEARGSRLILRRGAAEKVLPRLVRETGAGAVCWSRLYDPQSIERDAAVKDALQDCGVTGQGFGGHLLFEPEDIRPDNGGFFTGFTPMWNAVRNREVPEMVPAPKTIPAPDNWPSSEMLEDWRLGAGMHRGLAVVAGWQRPGEVCAKDRLAWFSYDGIRAYEEMRELVAVDGTSGMSEYLSLGEVSPRECWHEAQEARQQGAKGAELWQKQLVLRDYAHHLMVHTPHILTQSWNDSWAGFPWRDDEDHPDVLAWKQGRTGVPLVDAAMREMYVTGKMHNRARMIAASYLTKNLLTDWRIGQRWFEECLTDWDPAANAVGWQWVAGSGPDASPFAEIFDPEAEREVLDPQREYVSRWIAEGNDRSSRLAQAYFDAVPKRWGISARDPYPEPVVSLSEGKNRAIAAYEAL